jgi:hypothetical protein
MSMDIDASDLRLTAGEKKKDGEKDEFTKGEQRGCVRSKKGQAFEAPRASCGEYVLSIGPVDRRYTLRLVQVGNDGSKPLGRKRPQDQAVSSRAGLSYNDAST